VRKTGCRSRRTNRIIRLNCRHTAYSGLTPASHHLNMASQGVASRCSTSRCTTQQRAHRPTLTQSASGDHRRRDLSFQHPDTHTNIAHSDLMLSRTSLSINSTRQVGLSPRVASWSTPAGELRDGVCPATIIRGTEKAQRPSQRDEQSHRGHPAWFVNDEAIRRNDALEYPTLRAGIRNGADSDRGCRTP
jgi:hypothetical protein